MPLRKAINEISPSSCGRQAVGPSSLPVVVAQGGPGLAQAIRINGEMFLKKLFLTDNVIIKVQGFHFLKGSNWIETRPSCKAGNTNDSFTEKIFF